MGRLVGGDVRRVIPALWSLALAVLMLGGALGPGFVLTYDMVWVPDLGIRSDFFGLGSGLPRAVPSDAIVAIVDEIVPGMLLQKAVLVLTLVVAGVGAWRMVPETSRVASWAASTLYVWNPFVVERLGIGHWPLLMTYASLPWIHLAARRWVAGERLPSSLVLWMAFGSLSPAGGVIAALFAVVHVTATKPGAGRRLVLTGCVAAALSAPWIVAGALHGSDALSDPLGVSVFTAQGEGRLPTVLTLLSLGGVWNAEVVPASRVAWPGVAALVLVMALSWAGIASWRRRTSRGDRAALVTAAVAGLMLALAGSAVPGVMGWLVTHVPGAGLVRDGSRFVALLAPLLALLFGLGVARVVAAAPSRLLGVAVATGLVLSPVALMPDAAWGVSGQLRAVSYPAELGLARDALEERRELGPGGDLLSLPFTSYRRPSWNDGRRTLDPVGRYFPVNYLASDTLVVSGRVVPGEDARAGRVERLLVSLEGEDLLDALGDEGIRWVVVDHEAARAVAAESDEAPSGIEGATVLHSGRLFTLWELGSTGEAAPGEDPRPLRLVLLVLAWTAAGTTVVVAGARPSLAWVWRRRELRRRR